MVQLRETQRATDLMQLLRLLSLSLTMCWSTLSRQLNQPVELTILKHNKHINNTCSTIYILQCYLMNITLHNFEMSLTILSVCMKKWYNLSAFTKSVTCNCSNIYNVKIYSFKCILSNFTARCIYIQFMKHIPTTILSPDVKKQWLLMVEVVNTHV